VQFSIVIESLRAVALSLGRPPDKDETPAEILRVLTKHRLSWPRAASLLLSQLAADELFARSRASRRNDLLVHLALTQFPGSPKYRTLPKSIQSDIKAFFQNNAAAQEEGRRLLFASGDRAGVADDIKRAIADHLGNLRNNRWFRFRSTILQRLPSRLRVLVGCAEILQGGVEACDFVDIDLQAPRIMMVACDDIDSRISFVAETVTVDLNRLKVTANKIEPFSAPIYFKSQFLTRDDPLLQQALQIERALLATDLFTPGAPPPQWHTVQMAMKA
jgi:DNA phosphorothioation-associated putative methyltransferase